MTFKDFVEEEFKADVIKEGWSIRLTFEYHDGAGNKVRYVDKDGVLKRGVKNPIPVNVCIMDEGIKHEFKLVAINEESK